MGKIDTASKRYFGKPVNFADAFNFLLYEGKRVIDPARLRELDSTEVALPYKDKAVQQIQKQRDLLKAMTDGKAIYVILGAELQSEIHYAMPVRNGLYDFMDYSDQVTSLASKNREDNNFHGNAEFLSGLRRSDKIIPVITAVIYTGIEPWDGPMSLHDMMSFDDEVIKAATPDYKLHLISVADIDDADFEKFQAKDFGFAMKLLKHRDKDGDRIIEETNHRKIDTDTANFLKVAANLDLDYEIEDGGVDMCASLERKYKEKEQNAIAGNIQNLMETMKWTIEQAMDALKIPSNERAMYAGLVNAK